MSTPSGEPQTGVAALWVVPAITLGDEKSTENLRTITVSGTGEVKVKPDKSVVRLGVTTFNADLNIANTEADKRIAQIIAVMSKFGIASKDYQTDHLSISPRYEKEGYNERMDKLLGYEVTSGFGVTVRKLDDLNEFVAAAVEAGATHIHGVEFETTELRKNRDEARKLAMRAARDKAVLMASELSQKIGHARLITEGDQTYWASYLANQSSQGLFGGGGGGGLGGGRFIDAEEGGAETETIAVGLISISATVTVVFDLE